MRRLAVFARPPVEGRVKTRLSPALPPPEALALYAGMLEDTLTAVVGASAEERIVFWAEEQGTVPFELPGGVAERAQAQGDLGARLTEAFERLLDRPDATAVIVGADCPDLHAARISEAFAALGHADAVLGPSSDGGYYLIGLRRPAPALFHGIDWSTPVVLDQTLARAEEAGVGIVRLGTLDDIDTPADLARWIGRRAASGAVGAPATRAALARMGLFPSP